MAKAKTNPNKANQHRPDPRQALFLTYYLDRESETFSNALRSAMKAGYTKQTAESFIARMPTWLAEKLGDEEIIKKAEENVKEFLELDCENTGVTKKGDEFTFTDPRLMRIKSENSHFVLERLNKKKYSLRYEHTGKDGKDLPVPILNNVFSNDSNKKNSEPKQKD